MKAPTLVFRMEAEGKCDGCGKLGRTELELGLCWKCCETYTVAFDKLRTLSQRFARVVWPCQERRVGVPATHGRV